MALITRCPNCATAFRVTPLQLQAHGGDVRCGRCAHIFHGFATLATMQEPESVDLSRKTVPDQAGSPEIPSVSDSPRTALTDRQVSSQAPGNETAQTGPVPERPARVPAPEAPRMKEPALQEPYPASVPENESAENYSQNDYADDHAPDVAPSHKTSPAWGMGSLFLLVVLVAQAIYFYRAELSVIAPATRPYLEQYCELLGCTVPLPQNAVLNGSSEIPAAIRHFNVITLDAAVRNGASYLPGISVV